MYLQFNTKYAKITATKDKNGNELTAIINFSGYSFDKYRLGIDKGEYKIHIEETADSFTDKELSALELKYIRQYNTEEPNGYNKALTKAKPKEPDDYIHYNRMKFYFYQPGKDTYMVSPFYYPLEIEYFDIPKGETLKTMIESGRIYMSKNEELIKNKLIEWKNLKQD